MNDKEKKEIERLETSESPVPYIVKYDDKGNELEEVIFPTWKNEGVNFFETENPLASARTENAKKFHSVFNNRPLWGVRLKVEGKTWIDVSPEGVKKMIDASMNAEIQNEKLFIYKYVPAKKGRGRKNNASAWDEV